MHFGGHLGGRLPSSRRRQGAALPLAIVQLNVLTPIDDQCADERGLLIGCDTGRRSPPNFDHIARSFARPASPVLSIMKAAAHC